jgi:hypothetical protein
VSGSSAAEAVEHRNRQTRGGAMNSNPNPGNSHKEQSNTMNNNPTRGNSRKTQRRI